MEETISFWSNWLDREWKERMEVAEFQRILDLGSAEIRNDPEFWQRNSMWDLFNLVRSNSND